MQAAGHQLGQRILLATASDERDLDSAFARLAQSHVAALLVTSDAFFGSQRHRLAALAARVFRQFTNFVSLQQRVA